MSTDRVARYVIQAARTFLEARSEILRYLASQGWRVVGDLKVPHATSPDGGFRLWFKAQAVYFTEGNQHTLGGARTVSYDLDIRKLTPEQFLARIERSFPESFPKPKAEAVQAAAEESRDAVMERVIDALATWDNEQVEQHLRDLRKRVEALGDHEGLSPEDVELGCWAEALKEFDDYLKTGGLPESTIPSVTCVETFVNEEDQMQSFVWDNGNGTFNVTLKDLDSGEFVPVVKQFPDLQRAIQYAKTVHP